MIKNTTKTMPRNWCHKYCLHDYFRVVTKRLRCYIVYIYTFSLVVEFNICVDRMMCSNDLKNNKSNQFILTFRTCTIYILCANYEYKEIAVTKKLLKGNEANLNVIRGRVFTFPFFVNIVPLLRIIRS